MTFTLSEAELLKEYEDESEVDGQVHYPNGEIGLVAKNFSTFLFMFIVFFSFKLMKIR